MLNQHPYIIERLYQSRATELQQRALEQRLLKSAHQNGEGLLRRLFFLSASLVTMFF